MLRALGKQSLESTMEAHQEEYLGGEMVLIMPQQRTTFMHEHPELSL